MLLARHVHGPAAGVDDPLISYAGTSTAIGNARYLYADARGSLVFSSTSTGGAARVNSYDPYGVPGSTNTGRFQYTGQIWLAEAGLYYYKARMYSPTLGRFLQTDPIGYEDNVNLYGYVGNDPINFVDPFGLQNCEAGDQNCIETPESAELPGDPAPPSPEEEAVGQIIVTGNRPEELNFIGDNEHFFTLEGSTLEERTMSWRNVRCSSSRSIRVGTLSSIPADSNAVHSHGDGLEQHPGPRDDVGALASRGGVAGLMTRDRSFTIRAFDNGTYRVRQIEGTPLSEDERGELIENMQNWENRPDPGPSSSLRRRVC